MPGQGRSGAFRIRFSALGYQVAGFRCWVLEEQWRVKSDEQNAAVRSPKIKWQGTAERFASELKVGLMRPRWKGAKRYSSKAPAACGSFERAKETRLHDRSLCWR